jgi:hypothetical protein
VAVGDAPKRLKKLRTENGRLQAATMASLASAKDDYDKQLTNIVRDFQKRLKSQAVRKKTLDAAARKLRAQEAALLEKLRSVKSDIK